MTLIQDQLIPALRYHLNQVDTKGEIRDVDRQNIAQSLALFCDLAIRKYLKGQQEHGGRLTDRDLVAEIGNEIIDCFWYNEANKWRKG